jgi:hypothetical protein
MLPLRSSIAPISIADKEPSQFGDPLTFGDSSYRNPKVPPPPSKEAGFGDVLIAQVS